MQVSASPRAVSFNAVAADSWVGHVWPHRYRSECPSCSWRSPSHHSDPQRGVASRTYCFPSSLVSKQLEYMSSLELIGVYMNLIHVFSPITSSFVFHLTSIPSHYLPTYSIPSPSSAVVSKVKKSALLRVCHAYAGHLYAWTIPYVIESDGRYGAFFESDDVATLVLLST